MAGLKKKQSELAPKVDANKKAVAGVQKALAGLANADAELASAKAIVQKLTGEKIQAETDLAKAVASIPVVSKEITNLEGRETSMGENILELKEAHTKALANAEQNGKDVIAKKTAVSTATAEANTATADAKSIETARDGAEQKYNALPTELARVAKEIVTAKATVDGVDFWLG